MMWRFNIIQDWNSVRDENNLYAWIYQLKFSPFSHVFFHPTMVKIWLDTYMPIRKMSPLFVWGESSNGNKVFLPLVMWKKDWRGGCLRSIIPVGYSDYDYHDPLFLNYPNEDELNSFWSELLTLLRPYHADEILLEGFRDRSIISCKGEWKRGEICPSLDLTKIDCEDVLMSFFSTKLRGDIRRQIRRLGEMGTLRFVEYASIKDIPEGLFEQFMEAHRQRWPNAYKAPHFHERLVAASSTDGPIHFSTLMLDDTPIAWHLGFEFQGVYYYYMPAGNPEYQKQSPVKIHLYYLIARAINKGYVLYDHLRGDETYKSGWSDGYQYVNDMLIHSGRVSSKIKHGLIKLKSFIR